MKKPFDEDLKITAIYPREILDSRGNPTIEVEVHTRHGRGIASVPSGASTGIYEAFELRDGDKARYSGKGVQTAVKNIRTVIAPKLIGKNVTRQSNIDKLMIDLDATVVSVRRGAEQTLAEINAGSRDGVQEGWIMTIGRSGNFLGNLRIIAVDINNATGIVELEDPNGRGRVEAGDRVYARRGRS